MTKDQLKELDTLALAYMNNKDVIKKASFIDPTMDYEEYETRCDALVAILDLTYTSTLDKWSQLNDLFKGYNLKKKRSKKSRSVDDILASIK